MFSETASVHPLYTLAYLKATQIKKTRLAVEGKPVRFVHRPMLDIGLTRSHEKYHKICNLTKRCNASFFLKKRKNYLFYMFYRERCVKKLWGRYLLFK